MVRTSFRITSRTLIPSLSNQPNQESWKPNPFDLRPQHIACKIETDRRNMDGPKRKEVAPVIEGDEKADSLSAVRHCIEDAVRCETDQQKREDHGRRRWCSNKASIGKSCEGRKRDREEQRMRKPAMPERMLIRNAESECADVGIGKAGADRSDDQKTSRKWPPEVRPRRDGDG